MKNKQEAIVNTSLEIETFSPENTNDFECAKTLPTYYCEKCVFSTQLLVDLKHHTDEHALTVQSYHKFHLYSCDQCHFRTHSILILFSHNKFSMKGYSNCDTFPHLTKSKYYTQRHLTSSHPSKFPSWVKCTLCPFKTQRESSLQRHIKTLHTPIDKIQWFECKLCNHKTVRSDHMKRHMKEVHSCSIYKIQYAPKTTVKNKLCLCALCPWRSSNVASLQKHIREKHGILKEKESVEHEIPKVLAINCPQKQESGHNVFLCSFCMGHNVYQCVFCHMKTISRRMLSKHIKKVHENNDVVEETATEAPTFWCDQCSFSTQWMNSLKLHNLLKHRKKDLLLNLVSS